MDTIVLRLAPETRFRLELLAETASQSRSDLVARAVHKYVTEELMKLVEQGKLPPSVLNMDKPGLGGLNITV